MVHYTSFYSSLPKILYDKASTCKIWFLFQFQQGLDLGLAESWGNIRLTAVQRREVCRPGRVLVLQQPEHTEVKRSEAQTAPSAIISIIYPRLHKGHTARSGSQEPDTQRSDEACLTNVIVSANKKTSCQAALSWYIPHNSGKVRIIDPGGDLWHTPVN